VDRGLNARQGSLDAGGAVCKENLEPGGKIERAQATPRRVIGFSSHVQTELAEPRARQGARRDADPSSHKIRGDNCAERNREQFPANISGGMARQLEN